VFVASQLIIFEPTRALRSMDLLL